MVGKKSIYSSPVFKRGKVLSIPCSGQLFFDVNYFAQLAEENGVQNVLETYFFKANRDYYVKTSLNQPKSINVTNGQIDFLVEPKKITKLFLKSDGLDFDSSVLNRLSSLRSLNIESPNSVFRLNDIPYGCSSFVFIGGELRDGYTSRIFGDIIDTFDLRNDKIPSLSTPEVDQILTDLDDYTFVGNKLIRILGSNAPRSSAVASVVTSLENKGITVETYVDDDVLDPIEVFNSYNAFYSSNELDNGSILGICNSTDQTTIFQNSNDFNFNQPIYTNPSGTNLAPRNFYKVDSFYDEWLGNQWSGNPSICGV